MDLTHLSAGGFGLGLLALAVGLALAQRLRVRHEEVFVPTTLFWREALQDQRARTLVERFRHPWAYALVLLLAGLLWLAFAHPDARREVGTRHVLLLDGSAGMALPGRFDAALRALERELAAAPRDRTEVLWCGADVHTLLAPGEDRALLRARLAGRVPEAAPASVERALRERSRASWLRSGAAPPAPDSDARVRAVVFGDAPLRPDDRPSRVTLERADLGSRPTAELALTAVGIAPAASGDWTRVDVLATVRGAGASDAVLDLARADGAPLGGALQRVVRAPDHVEHLVQNVPADGATLRFTPGVGAAAELCLPVRRRVRVAIDPGLAALLGDDAAAAFTAALGADDAVERVEGPPYDLWVGAAGSGGPELTFRGLDAQDEAILVQHDAGLTSSAALAAALGELGLDRLDAGAWAETLGRPIALGAAPGAARAVSLWRELAASPAFLEDRGFPLLVGRAVRWLASAPGVAPYAAVGRIAPQRVGRSDAGLGTSLGTAQAVTLATPGAAAQREHEWAATAAARAAGDTPAAPRSAAAPEGPGGWRPLTWVLALALAGLVLEWALVQRGRMP